MESSAREGGGVVIGVTILLVSTALFLWWFRYVCELILSVRTAVSCAEGVSAATGLHWHAVSRELRTASLGAFGRIHSNLRSDYRKLDAVLSRAGSNGQLDFERGMLNGYFSGCAVMFALLRPCSERAAREMLAAMVRVVEHQADLIGERVNASELRLT